MPFSADELAPTLRPLAEAWQLPPRAFTDEAVAAWELEHLFQGGWAWRWKDRIDRRFVARYAQASAHRR